MAMTEEGSVSRFKAVIFDMDGVLVDSEPVYLGMVRDCLARHGCPRPLKAYDHLAGGSRQDFVSCVMDSLHVGRRRAFLIFAVYALSHPVDYTALVRPQAQALTARLAGAGLRLAVASSSSKRAIGQMLAAGGMDGLFELTVSGYDFKHSKPDPEIYEVTVRRLGLDKADVAVVEDSTRGIQAAKAAGLFTIALRDSRYAFQPQLADVQIDSLDQAAGIIIPGR